MHWVQLLFVTLFVGCLGKDIDIENDINEPPTPLNLDTNLRKALLKALSELEREEKDKLSEEEGSSKAVFFSSTVSSTDVEKASATAVSIFTSQETTSTDEAVTEAPTTTEKPIVIVQKSAGVQHRPIVSSHNNLPDPTEEQFETSASSSFRDDFNNKNENLQTRSVGKVNLNSVVINDKSLSSGVKSVSITPKTEATTAFPTSTTEENQAKVEDVQFFSAPLVAAFTVHQDERGLPKKVEPIFKTTAHQSKQFEQQEKIKQDELIRQESLIHRELQQDQFRSQITFQEKQKSLEAQLVKLQRDQKEQQDNLLKQQQILLDQQLRNQKLREQAEKERLKQNEQPFVPIISPTNFANTNQFNQFSNTKQFSNNVIPTGQFNNFNNVASNQFSNTNQFSNQFNQNSITNSNQNFNNQNKFNSQVNIVPAIQFQSHSIGLSNQFTNQNNVSPPQQFNNVNNNFQQQQQQPPAVNNFNNFQQNPNQFNFNNNNNNFNRFKTNTVVSLQPSLSVTAADLSNGVLPINGQVLPIKNAIDFHQSPPPFNQFNPPAVQQQNFGAFQNFPNNFVQSLPSRQSNRVFRQENNVANLGFNQFQPQQNRFFRSNYDNFNNQNYFQQPQQVNQHLNNLLYHSGITRNVRQNEDLNIVSKILSYNVGRDNLFAGSRISEQRLPSH